MLSEAKLCFAQVLIHCCFKPGLDNSGEKLIGCLEQADGPVHFWVCVLAFPFVDFYYLCQFPFRWDLLMCEDFCEEAGQMLKVAFCEPFECLCWDVVCARRFVVLHFSQDCLKFLNCDGLHVDWVGACDGGVRACVVKGGFCPVSLLQVICEGVCLL